MNTRVSMQLRILRISDKLNVFSALQQFFFSDFKDKNEEKNPTQKYKPYYKQRTQLYMYLTIFNLLETKK